MCADSALVTVTQCSSITAFGNSKCYFDCDFLVVNIILSETVTVTVTCTFTFFVNGKYYFNYCLCQDFHIVNIPKLN